MQDLQRPVRRVSVPAMRLLDRDARVKDPGRLAMEAADGEKSLSGSFSLTGNAAGGLIRRPASCQDVRLAGRGNGAMGGD